MENNPIILVFLPISLGIIMIGLGLHLTLADFGRVVKQPKAVVIALLVQMVLLPPICFLIAKLFKLPPELGLGLLLLVVFLAAMVDVPMQAFFFKDRLKMSHEEVKQEHKESDGNPLIKSRMRQRQREIAEVHGFDLIDHSLVLYVRKKEKDKEKT